MEEVKEFTRDEFLNSREPYEYLYGFINQPFEFAQKREQLKQQAILCGVKNFISILTGFLKSVKQMARLDGVTNFTGQELELMTCDYICDDYGVSGADRLGMPVTVCPHPIMPTKRIVNIDTGDLKTEIAFMRGGRWRKLIVDKAMLASSSKIIELAAQGVAVDSESARFMVKYFTDMEQRNYDELPEVDSVGRLGWVGDGQFSPYVDKVEFDGSGSFKNLFECVRSEGGYLEWAEAMKAVRRGNVCARLVLAASFASALIEPCDCLNFFVHLWGGTGSGKTVAIMAAASVWADPTMGRYVKDFNATNVGFEQLAGFLHSMPMIIDEFQMRSDKKGFESTLYMLAEGAGKTRGAKNGGLQHIPTWNLCILTTGEQPISGNSTGGGAVNRMIEIDCKDKKFFDEPKKFLSVIKQNFGFAGRIFILALSDDEVKERALRRQNELFSEITAHGVTEKQAMAASVIVAADEIATEFVFGCDGCCLTVDEIVPFLSTNDDVDKNKRAYEFIKDYININRQKFAAQGDEMREYYAESWGFLKEGYAYIVPTVFNHALEDEGFNARAFLSWAKEHEIIECDKDKARFTKTVRAPGEANVRKFICISLNQNAAESDDTVHDAQERPF